MSPVMAHRICCPLDQVCIALPETILGGIIRNRRASTTGDPFLTLICPACRNAFQFDWKNRNVSPCLVPIDEHLLEREPVRFSYVVRCDDKNCESRTELIAIRDHRTTEEQCRAEVSTWTVNNILCSRGHQIVNPTPPIEEQLTLFRWHFWRTSCDNLLEITRFTNKPACQRAFRLVVTLRPCFSFSPSLPL